jgi:hypothetical protein
VAEDITAAIALGQVDDAAAVNQNVLGLVDELGRYLGRGVSLGLSGMKYPVMCGSWGSLTSLICRPALK